MYFHVRPPSAEARDDAVIVADDITLKSVAKEVTADVELERAVIVHSMASPRMTEVVLQDSDESDVGPVQVRG